MLKVRRAAVPGDTDGRTDGVPSRPTAPVVAPPPTTMVLVDVVDTSYAVLVTVPSRSTRFSLESYTQNPSPASCQATSGPSPSPCAHVRTAVDTVRLRFPGVVPPVR